MEVIKQKDKPLQCDMCERRYMTLAQFETPGHALWVCKECLDEATEAIDKALHSMPQPCKLEKGQIVCGHCCDRCYSGQTENEPKYPADSGSASWYCNICGHLGIGSTVKFCVGDWLKLEVIDYANVD